MSHLRTCELEITNPIESAIEEALEIMCRNTPGLSLVREIEDYAGNRISVPRGVRGTMTHRGYGVKVEDGRMKTIGDDYGQSMKIEQFNKQLNQAYRAAVYARGFSKNGYRPSIVQQKGKLVVVGQA